MKTLIQTVVIAAALAAPVVSFAQSSVTREQVRAELVQLEKAGYHPALGSDPHYPDDLQAAEARVAAQNSADHSYGGVNSASSQSGRAPE
ncbi:MAG TPA: DUF4148 domain-containing protein [Paraburkholderia sp.]|jgi:hypothetical protein